MSLQDIFGTSTDEKFICFTLGNDSFALPLVMVKEVIANTKLTDIPNSPDHFKGVFSLRGEIVPVIDLKHKLKSKAIAKSSQETAIIVLDLKSFYLGISVATVESVDTLSRDIVSPAPTTESSLETKYILGIAQTEKGLLVLLDVPKLLNLEDYKVIDNQKLRAS